MASAYYGAAGFSIGTKGYLGTGVWNPTMLFADCFFEYDPVVNVWTQKANYGGGAVYGAVGFSIGSKGYFGTGTGFQNDFWEYDPSNDTWTQKTDYPGLGRLGAIGFTIECKGYMGTGMSQFGSTQFFSQDFWEYTPDSACTTGIEEFLTSNLEVTISPNPAKDFLIISCQLTGKEKINLTITDVNGKVLTKSQIIDPKPQIKIDISEFSKGIYFVEASNGKQKTVKKFLKE
jgi:hypothetical protein